MTARTFRRAGGVTMARRLAAAGVDAGG